MANFCMKCGAKLVDGKCVNPGCVNYTPVETQNQKRKVSPGVSEQSIPDINNNPYLDLINDDDTDDEATQLDYENTPRHRNKEERVPRSHSGGKTQIEHTAEQLQSASAAAYGAASDAVKTGWNSINEKIEDYKKHERDITSGTGRGFTGKGNETITGVKLSQDEKMVRTYHCTTFRRFFKKVDGYLTVTNKRVIFESKDDTSRISNEVTLDGISGFRNYYGTNFNPVLLALAVLFALGFFYMIGQANQYSGYYGGSGFTTYAVVFLVIAIACAFFARRRSVVISVFSSKSMGTPIVVGEGPKGMLGNAVLYTMTGLPTEDTGTMIREVGAMVQDLQTRGDHAINDWVIKEDI